MTLVRPSLLSIGAFALVFAISSASTSETQAQGPWHPRSIYSGHGSPYSAGIPRSYPYGGLRYSAPIYHAPSVHFDHYYHHDYYHWTPRRGLHSHGHYDAVPHYTPGHFDHSHGNHIHGNPHFHH
jgi:hypothetical protein